MTIKNLIHDCQPPLLDPLPDGVLSGTSKWRCPECKQRWSATLTRSGTKWSRRGYPSIMWEARERAKAG